MPNFDKFRKRLFIFGGLGLVLIAFLVWAIFFAPHGTITVKAETTNVDVAKPVTLTSDSTDVETGVISPVIKQKKNNESIQFAATGTKEIGEKATGTITISVKESSITSAGLTIAAGTQVIANDSGLRFATDKAVTFPGSIASGTISVNEYKKYCQSNTCYVSVDATAANIGPEYNIPDDTSMTVSGGYSATSKTAFSGGSKEVAKVVQQSDVDLATEKLKNQLSGTDVEAELTSQMSDDVTIIPDSFTVDYGQFVSDPAVGQAPGNKQPTLTVEVTYTLIGVSNKDLNALLDVQMEDKIADDSAQKIYDNGFKSVKFRDFQATGNGFSVVVATTGKIGPRLDEEQIKEMAVDKRSGEIRESLTKINGVSDVQVDFSPFWVGSVSKTDQLTVNFAVDE